MNIYFMQISIYLWLWELYDKVNVEMLEFEDVQICYCNNAVHKTTYFSNLYLLHGNHETKSKWTFKIKIIYTKL